MLPPSGEMRSRWQKIREAMASYQIGGILVFSNQINPEPIHYLANYTLVGEKAFCYLPAAENQPVLFISEPWNHERAVSESGFKDVRVIGKSFFHEIATLCKKYGEPLGIAGRENMTRVDIVALEAAISRETLSATRLLEDAATVKSPYELDLIRAASRMADAGFERAIQVARLGLSDFELAAEIDYAVRNMGATENFQMLAVGRDNTGMHLPNGKKIESGDLLLFELTPAFGSITYSAQLCNTAIMGNLPDLVKEKYAILTEALEESLLVIKEGVRMGEVVRIQDEIISRGGYGEYCKPPYMQQRGHGFGLGSIKLKAEVTKCFEKGMSLVVHPNQFIPETGYLALGEHIIVTANGIERLTRIKPKIYECSAK